MYNMPFQYDRPVFVKIPFRARGKLWKKNHEFPWREMNIATESVESLYANDYLLHSPDLEVSQKKGDGLEELPLDILHKIVDEYVERVKEVAQHKTQFEQRKPKKSKLADKQRGLIRSWRRNHLDWLEKAEDNKKG